MTKAEKSAYDRKRYLERRKEIIERARRYSKSEQGREVNRRASLKYTKQHGFGKAKRFYEKMKQDSEAYVEHLRRKRAQNAVHYALKTGKLVKGKCEVCGSLSTHAHHDNYDNRLNVKWLCPLHHGKIRRLEEAA